MKIFIVCFMVLFLTQCMNQFQNIDKKLKENYFENKKLFNEIKTLCENQNRFYIQFNTENNINVIVWDEKNNYKTVFEKSDYNYEDEQSEQFFRKLGYSKTEFKKLYHLLKEINCKGIKYTEINSIFTKDVIELDYDINHLNAYIYILFLEDTPKLQMKEISYEENVKWIDNNVGWTVIGPAWS